MTTRGITSHIYPEDIANNVLLPIPDPDLAQGLSDLVNAAQDARSAHAEKVREAIRIVDEQTPAAAAAAA